MADGNLVGHWQHWTARLSLLFLHLLLCFNTYPVQPVTAALAETRNSTAAVQRPTIDVRLDFGQLDRLPPVTSICNCTFQRLPGLKLPIWGNAAIAQHEGRWYIAVYRQFFGYHDSTFDGDVANIHTNWGLVDTVVCDMHEHPAVAAAAAAAAADRGPGLGSREYPHDAAVRLGGERSSAARCVPFKPASSYVQCHHHTGGLLLAGLADPRLFSWPGKGLYLLTNCRPSLDGAACNHTLKSALCLSRVDTSMHGPQRDVSDPWQYKGNSVVVLTHPRQGIEKNWVPFVHDDQLYFSHSLTPHKVMSCQSNGTCIVKHAPGNFRRLFKIAPGCCEGPRGNTQAVLVPAVISGLKKDIYLGIAHMRPPRQFPIESLANAPRDPYCRQYLNYYYAMQAEPPFALLTTTMEPIPLQSDLAPLFPGIGWIAFPEGLEVDLATRQVLIAYGAGDKEPRLYVTNLDEVIAGLNKIHDLL